MSVSAASSRGDFINHYTGVRIRMQGSGVLRPTMIGQDNSTTDVLPTMTMSSSNRFSNFVLANVTNERVLLQLQTTAIDETFTIHRIIVLARQVATEIPA